MARWLWLWDAEGNIKLQILSNTHLFLAFSYVQVTVCDQAFPLLEPFSCFLLTLSSIHFVNSVLQLIFLDSPSKSRLEGPTWVPQSALDFPYHNVYVLFSLPVCHFSPQIHELHKSWDCTVYILSNSRCLILERRRCKRCGFDPGSGRSPGKGNGNTLQYSCLEYPMDRRAWWAIVHGAAKESDTTEYTQY